MDYSPALPDYLRRLAMALSVFLVATAATANPARNFERSWEMCRRHTAAQERADAIPTDLLTAISLAESGRWDDMNRETIAWPWTITARGEGRFLDSKAAAVAAVRRLRRDGFTNIDVGCMQVNLHYHGDAFAGLEEALDPAANIAYAAEFLTNLHGETGSWRRAAAHYHSRTPERGQAYEAKVVRLWKATRDRAEDAADDVTPASRDAALPIRAANETKGLSLCIR